MPDPLTPWLASYLPVWLSAQVVSGILGALFGFAATRLITFLVGWRIKRRERIAADDTLRKLDARKYNEHMKLIGSFCNTVGAAIIGAAFIVPYIGNHVDPAQVDLRWVGAGLALPLVGHFALRFMKSE